MGRNASRTNYYAKGSSQPIAVNSNGKKLTAPQVNTMLSSSSSTSTMLNRDMEKQINRAISRYEAVMGIRERNVRLADLDGAYGVTYINKDGSQGIFLNKKEFDVPKQQFEATYKSKNYETGFKNYTNRAAQHTVTHELAHATWTSSYQAPNCQAAGKEINALYKKWVKDKKKKDYGSYSRQNVDEFWAETITKGIHGNSDEYTKKAIAIAKKYKL